MNNPVNIQTVWDWYREVHNRMVGNDKKPFEFNSGIFEFATITMQFVDYITCTVVSIAVDVRAIREMMEKKGDLR